MTRCVGTFKENNRGFSPAGPSLNFADISQELKRQQWILMGTQGSWD